jgi:hypothetical protein
MEHEDEIHKTPMKIAGNEVVRIAGLEPAHLSALPPQSSVSANSTICATGGGIKQLTPGVASRFSEESLRVRRKQDRAGKHFESNRPAD